jgi:Holliday junction resolvase RusA-like endonuclease
MAAQTIPVAPRRANPNPPRHPRVRLTRTHVAGLTAPTDQVYTVHWDAEVPGFGVRVMRSGRKVYFWQGKTRFKRGVKVTIGHADRIPLERARLKARELIAEAELGEDPAARVRLQKQHRRPSPAAPAIRTLRDAIEFYAPIPQMRGKRSRADRRASIVRALLDAHPGMTPRAVPVVVHVMAEVPPASAVADVDNLLKPVLDALAGLAYVNDAQVVECLVRKTPSLNRRLLVKIWFCGGEGAP